MAKAEVGQKVRVHYSGKLDDGSEFDSTESDGPMELTIGEGDALPAFEQALIGMAPGDTRTVHVPRGGGSRPPFRGHDPNRGPLGHSRIRRPDRGARGSARPSWAASAPI